MKTKPIIITLLAVGLLVVCALGILAGYAGFRWVGANSNGAPWLFGEGISAEVRETQTFEVSGPAELEVRTDAGDVTVIAADVQDIEVEIIKTAWAATQEDAQAEAEAIRITTQQQGNRLTLSYLAPARPQVVRSNELNTVSFVIRVPVETAVSLTAGLGSLRLEGTTGNAILNASFGAIQVSGVTGALTVEGKLGDITVESVDAGADGIDLRATFGEITATGLDGGSLVVGSNNGDITLRQVSFSGTMEVEEEFGDVLVEQAEASSLNITNTNGDVDITDCLLSGDLEAISTFGTITVAGTSAENFTLETNNGDISLDGGSGMLAITNSFGDVTITGAGNVTLQITTMNGEIEFSGSLNGEVSHRVENSFGSIRLAIPAESAFDVEFTTEFGEITSELPITISGSLSTTEMSGSMNNCGPLLTVQTNNGDISLTVLPGE